MQRTHGASVEAYRSKLTTAQHFSNLDDRDTNVLSLSHSDILYAAAMEAAAIAVVPLAVSILTVVTGVGSYFLRGAPSAHCASRPTTELAYASALRCPMCRECSLYMRRRHRNNVFIIERRTGNPTRGIVCQVRAVEF